MHTAGERDTGAKEEEDPRGFLLGKQTGWKGVLEPGRCMRRIGIGVSPQGSEAPGEVWQVLGPTWGVGRVWMP